jgi:diguanylate cyclase (GGDEF)-like protein
MEGAILDDSIADPRPTSEITEVVYQLIRENQAILSSLSSAEHDLKKLKLELDMALDGQLQLSIKLADADKEIERLTIGLISAQQLADSSASSLSQSPGQASMIKLSMKHFRELFERSSEAFLLIDGEHLTLCNQAASLLFGVADRSRIQEQTLLMLSPSHQPGGIPSEELAKKHAEAAQQLGNVNFDWVFRRQDNHADVPCEVILTALPMDDSKALLASVRDATERLLHAQQMQDMAYFDSLTGLPNRRLLVDRIAQALTQSKRSGHHGALIFLDLDNFKSLNDRYGHAFGDEVLRQTATRIQHCLRGTDTVSRQGGDEFVVVIVDLGEDLPSSQHQGQQVAEKIRLALETPFEHPASGTDLTDDAAPIHCPASLGMVIFKGHQEVSNILEAADSAMYRAKAAGGNRIETAPPLDQLS